MGARFTKVTCTFLKPVRKDGFFDDPFDLFEEKKFSSLRRDNELLIAMKRSKMEETAQNIEKQRRLAKNYIHLSAEYKFTILFLTKNVL